MNQPKEALKELMRCFNWHNGYTNEDRDAFYKIVHAALLGNEELKPQRDELLAAIKSINKLAAMVEDYNIQSICNEAIAKVTK